LYREFHCVSPPPPTTFFPFSRSLFVLSFQKSNKILFNLSLLASELSWLSFSSCLLRDSFFAFSFFFFLPSSPPFFSFTNGRQSCHVAPSFPPGFSCSSFFLTIHLLGLIKQLVPSAFLPPCFLFSSESSPCFCRRFASPSRHLRVWLFGAGFRALLHGSFRSNGVQAYSCNSFFFLIPTPLKNPPSFFFFLVSFPYLRSDSRGLSPRFTPGLLTSCVLFSRFLPFPQAFSLTRLLHEFFPIARRVLSVVPSLKRVGFEFLLPFRFSVPSALRACFFVFSHSSHVLCSVLLTTLPRT